MELGEGHGRGGHPGHPAHPQGQQGRDHNGAQQLAGGHVDFFGQGLSHQHHRDYQQPARMEQAQEICPGGVPQTDSRQTGDLAAEQIDGQEGDADFHHEQPQALGDHHHVLIGFFIVIHQDGHGREPSRQAAHDGTEQVGKGVPVHVNGHGHRDGQGEQAGPQDPQGFLAQFEKGIRGAVAADAVAGHPQHKAPPGTGPEKGVVQKGPEKKSHGNAPQHIGNGDGQLPQQEACQGRCQECGESFHGKELLPRVQRMVCTVR